MVVVLFRLVELETQMYMLIVENNKSLQIGIQNGMCIGMKLIIYVLYNFRNF